MKNRKHPATLTEYLDLHRDVILAAYGVILRNSLKGQRSSMYLVANEVLGMHLMRRYRDQGFKLYRMIAVISTAYKLGAFAEFGITNKPGVGFVVLEVEHPLRIVA